MAEKVLRISDVSKKALKSVSVEVQRADFLIILAPSGSGKTTLLNLISGMESLESGRISVDGIDLSGIRDRDVWRATNVGYIYEEDNLISSLSVYDNVDLPLIAAGVGRADRHDRVSRALAAVGLSDKAGLRADRLGMEDQQRAALARAVAAEPVVILADEPTGRLTADETERLIGLMAELNRNDGLTFIVATHNPLMRKVATDVLELRA
jgi:putative ABC transport system ATP-binding protein